MLRQLRLSGVLDSLAARNREAVEGKLAYTEFPVLVIQDEVVRREQKKVAARVRRAGLLGEMALEGFGFSLKPMRQPQDEMFHDLIAERYERGATIVTSNLDFSEWGAATLDRLRHGAYRLVLDADSYRRPRPPWLTVAKRRLQNAAKRAKTQPVETRKSVPESGAIMPIIDTI